MRRRRRRPYKRRRAGYSPQLYIVKRISGVVRGVKRSFEKRLWRLIRQSLLQGVIESILAPILMYYQSHYTGFIVVFTPILGELLVVASSLRLVYRIDYRLHGFANMLTEVGVRSYIPRLIHNLSLCIFSLLTWKITGLEGSFQLTKWCLSITVMDSLLTLLAWLEQEQ